MSQSAGSGRRRRLIVGITGASGAVFGVRLLDRLREFDVEVHLIVSAWGARTITHETGYSLADVQRLADVVHTPRDQAAQISSGSFLTDGMIIAPCSVKTLAAIAAGYSDDLIARSADVVLKERRPLVLMVRESPLSVLHLENMLKVARAGAVIVPPMPAFYNHPKTVEDVVDHILTRALDQIGLASEESARWDGRLIRRTERSEESGG
jgi:flavin prenyltransferase